MSFSSILLSTFKKEKSAIALYVVNTITIMAFYYLLYDNSIKLYPLILTTTFLLLYLIYKFFCYRNLYICLKQGKDNPKYEISEESPFKDIFDILKEVHSSYICKIQGLETTYENRDKLMAEWIHNMKTSLSVISLGAEKGIESCDRQIFKDILEEKDKLQENLEGALNIFRLQEFTKDYIPEKISLRQLVNSAINAKKKNFIYNNVFPKVDIDEDYYIYTDKKWGKYVIEQIINNAIKYSYKEKSYLRFYSEKKEKVTFLYMKDEGIGIKQQDMPRIFEPFFTGTNGRDNKESSGIGLYMCKTICDKLCNDISIDSKEGQGTTVTIRYFNGDMPYLSWL